MFVCSQPSSYFCCVLIVPSHSVRRTVASGAMEPGREMTIGEVMAKWRRERPQLDALSIAVLTLLADDLFAVLGYEDYFNMFCAIEDLLPERADWRALAVFIE